MGKAIWGRLSEAWPGEATDFTPELARHLKALDENLGLGLADDALTEVPATGGRRIDILATGSDNVRYVIENQYNRADHDHLTRGLAYAISAEAEGLIVVAEGHGDEFRAVANYLNDVALRAGHGVKVWLVEARAVRVDDSAWAPVFMVVTEPIPLIEAIASRLPTRERTISLDESLAAYENSALRDSATELVTAWLGDGLKVMPVLAGASNVVRLMAPGPATSGARVVLTSYADGRVSIPFRAYEGLNTGIPIPQLATEEFRDRTVAQFSLDKSGYSPVGWLTHDRVAAVLEFAREVRDAYRVVLDEQWTTSSSVD